MTYGDNQLISKLTPITSSIWLNQSRYIAALTALWLLTFGLLFASEYSNNALIIWGSAVAAALSISLQYVMTFAMHRIFMTIMKFVA